MARKLTGFERMWNVYPAPTGEAADAKKAIGGAVNADWIENTCVIRVSRSMNYAGHPIPEGLKGLATVAGKDGLRYAYRVIEMHDWLTATYGPATLAEKRAELREGPPESFVGKRGILCFRVEGWADATGHLDLWDGAAPRHAEYFAKSSEIKLWIVESNGGAKLAKGAWAVPIEASVGRDAKNEPDDVARVQSLLLACGFDAGNADGIAGPRTLGAILDFQRANGVGADGRVDPNGHTWRALNGVT